MHRPDRGPYSQYANLIRIASWLTGLTCCEPYSIGNGLPEHANEGMSCFDSDLYDNFYRKDEDKVAGSQKSNVVYQAEAT